jgi:tripartite-type tricarboxylate transporter receptor subunit TctC
MKKLLSLALALVVGTSLVNPLRPARADTFPSRPVVMVVPYAAGGTGDVLGRVLAREMSKSLGQQVIVELHPGAGGNLGAQYVAKVASPDGYTFLLAASSLATNASLMKLSFEPTKDLSPIAGIAAIPHLVVTSPASPFKSLAEVVAAAKAHPSKPITFGSSGLGTGSHLAGELFKSKAGINMLHVPYKGSGAVYPDLIGQRINLLFDVMGSAIGQVQSGNVRALANTSKERSKSLPDVPTVAEQGFPGYEYYTWFGIFAPAGAPAEAKAKLEQAAIAAVRSPAVTQLLSKIGSEDVPHSAEKFGAFFNNDVARWAQMVKDGAVARIQ